MKAIVVRQPWATLIALGVKTIETRPGPPNGPMRPEGVRGLPGCTLGRGERIAIVAGASLPLCPDPLWESDDRSGWWLNFTNFRVGDERATGEGWWIERWQSGDPDMTEPLPLGAVVCTVTVDDALPIVGEPMTGSPYDTGAALLDEGDGLLTYLCGDLSDQEAGQFDDQQPLGDYRPGRWGWLLGNVQQTEPIPCKGKQGVFVLPDDVTARLSP